MKYRHSFLLSLAAAASLAACSGPYNIAANVSTFGSFPADRAGASYAFERLPSQKDSKRQGELEDQARAALEKAGFKPAGDAKTADILVTLGARMSAEEYAPWDDPFWWRGRGPGWRVGGPWYGYAGPCYGFHRTLGPCPLDVRYDREVAMLMRDRVSNEPVYEAHASHESGSRGDDGVTTALFAAALADFPKAEPQSHRVTVQAER